MTEYGKVYCRDCKHYSIYFGDWTHREVCAKARKYKIKDTYYAPGKEKKQEPPQQNKYNNCIDYEGKYG